MNRLIVRKSLRRLELWQKGKKTGSWPIGLGKTPLGPKHQAGDGRTPEGWYYLCTRNPKSKFHLSLGISYPNPIDASKGLDQGILTKAEAAAICKACKEKKRPPWDTALGGEIMLHGGGAWDWTAGCIAVTDQVMDLLWENCPLGMEILILP